jgi:2-phospho-L-lactate guanylyltransferase
MRISGDAVAWALLPMKDLVQAKSRLGGVLASHERRALAQAMAEDVLTALAGCDHLAGILLVSDDPGADMLAHKYGAEMLPEASLGVVGLNAILTAACELLSNRGTDVIAIVHSDLPLLTTAEIESLLAAISQPGVDVVIAPDRRNDGTNLMVTGAEHRPVFRYGVGSCGAHQAAAREAGLNCELLPLPGAALDVDQPVDLIDLWDQAERGRGGAYTRAFLSRPDIAKRLAVLAEDVVSGRRAR